jgi:hypothetical protein
MVLQHQYGPKQWCKFESACIGADSFSTAKCRKIETLIPAILTVLQHHYGPKQ